MGIHQKRLGIGVADHTYSGIAPELAEFRFELGPEIRTLKTVDAPEKAFFSAVGCETCPARAEMGMVVCTVEKVCYTRIFPGNGSEYSAHRIVFVDFRMRRYIILAEKHKDLPHFLIKFAVGNIIPQRGSVSVNMPPDAGARTFASRPRGR